MLRTIGKRQFLPAAGDICLSLILAALTALIVLAAHPQTAEGASRYKNIRLAIVDTRWRKRSARLEKMFTNQGAKVSWVKSTAVDPSDYDGLLVPGGADVNPSLYGESPAGARRWNTSRDKLQISVIQKFAIAKKPVLGICGGEQHINVAFGGTLYQNIPYHRGFRKIKLSKKSLWYKALGAKPNVRHGHHQCVKELGSSLRATAWDVKTGYIEAVESKYLPVYGLQWHPEHMNAKMQEQTAKPFLEVCLQYKSGDLRVRGVRMKLVKWGSIKRLQVEPRWGKIGNPE